MSKLDYRRVVFYPLPEYHMKWPQRVQTKCAGYVLGRYAVLEDLQKLNWLPIIKRRDLALLRITRKALYDDFWPDYLRPKFHTVSAYNLRSLFTFQDSAARLLDTLPDELKEETDYTMFVRLAKKLMFSVGESVSLIFILTIIIIMIIIFNLALF